MAVETPTTAEPTGTSKEDIIDFLGQEDELLSDKKDLLADDESEEPVKDKKNKEEKELELSDEENDDDEIKEDDLEELVVPARKKEILAKYPKLFKDFPYLEKAYYREQQYTEIFPTIDDAREVQERVQTFEKFESALFSGNTESVLKSVKDADEKAYGKIVDNYLPTLQKVDNNAYLHVIGTVFSSAVTQMAQEADRLNNEHLRNAALVLNQFIFGSSKPVSVNKFSKEVDPKVTEEADKLKSERDNYFQERLDNTVGTLSDKVNNRIKSTIAQNIDPKETMSPYVRKTAIKDAMELLDRQIGQDSRYQSIKNGLWKKVIETNFSRQAVDAVESAHISKVRTLLRDVISKTRNEALKGSDSKRSISADSSDSFSKSKKEPLPVGKSAGQSKSGGVPRGMKTLDFLNQD